MSELIRELAKKPKYEFSKWPIEDVPHVAAGIYLIWSKDQFMYVGMSGRGASVEDLRRKKESGKSFGLFNRLNSHAAGRRSGDQFCVYVADRLVLPNLSKKQIEAIASRELSFDKLVKQYISDEMSFSFAETADGFTALQLEIKVRKGLLGSRPYLNPYK
jgi:hypothetical protein